MAGSCSSVVRKRGCEALRREKLSFSVVRGLEADFNDKGRFAKEVFWREEAGAPAVDGDGKVDCLGVEVLHSELSWMASSWLKCIGGAGHLDARENRETGERVCCSNCLVKKPSSATGIAEDSLRTGLPKGLLRRSHFLLSVGGEESTGSSIMWQWTIQKFLPSGAPVGGWDNLPPDSILGHNCKTTSGTGTSFEEWKYHHLGAFDCGVEFGL